MSDIERYAESGLERVVGYDDRNLYTDIRQLTELVLDLDKDVQDYKDGLATGPGIEPDLIALAMLQEARRNLATIEQDLTNVLARRMPTKLIPVEGAGTFEKHKKTNRTKWDREALLPDVLDTRIFDKYSGELIDETPLQKVLHVWLLGAPRTTALRDRGLDPDQYCESEDAGWTIQLKTST